MRPLDGLVVVDLAWVVAGPLVGRALADAGATVVRVESSTRIETARMMPPFHGAPGPESSALYGTCNAGKLGLSLNLTTEKGRQVVRDLSSRADVVVESFAPGRLNKWGLDYETLCAENPRLIMLSSSINGQTGPLAGLAGYGNVGAALSGFQSIVGWPDRPPFGPFGPYTDYVAPRFALAALLAALIARDESGEGCYIDLSQVEAGTYLLQPEIARNAAENMVARRRGNRDEVDVPSGVYRASDGNYVAISVDSEQWPVFVGTFSPTMAGDPRFTTVSDRRAFEDELDEEVERAISVHTAAEVESMAQEVGIPAHISASSADLIADPQLRHREHFVSVESSVTGWTTVEGPRYRLSDTPLQVDGAAPTIGEHSDAVLRDLLGMTDEEIEDLEKRGVLN
ncbi:CaiB/BaiF CoA transferase family protein [Gordonia sp. (in: high G+C Gram-positive bacteria)]|uniref:CaiB/BaiF CoA transferase family protein n=1 Tax=Gordonia sp. (in: high G+C Gram-positive bacteria) TaxID=84139 RepID=UPI003F9E78F0